MFIKLKYYFNRQDISKNPEKLVGQEERIKFNYAKTTTGRIITVYGQYMIKRKKIRKNRIHFFLLFLFKVFNIRSLFLSLAARKWRPRRHLGRSSQRYPRSAGDFFLAVSIVRLKRLDGMRFFHSIIIIIIINGTLQKERSGSRWLFNFRMHV